MELRELRGLVASVVITGNVDDGFSACWTEMRANAIETGFKNIEWVFFQAPFVELGRDEVCKHALHHNYDWLLMVDADAIFEPRMLMQMLETAFVKVPDSHAVGAYAQLKHHPHLPVIDTGTGTWEEHYPGEGILQCIRTGGHCILVKTAALRMFGPPWFRTRTTLRPVDALREVDNYARIKLDGKNPFVNDTWKQLLDHATEELGGVISNVGEDSGFCDALVAAGGKLYVNTDIVTGHVMKKTLKAQDLKDALRAREADLALSVGVWG